MALVTSVAKAEPPASDGPIMASELEIVAKHKRAADLYESGLLSFERGNMMLAITDFRSSYELDQDFHVLYNIAECARRLGHDVDAARAYEAYLREGGNRISKDRFDEVVAHLAMLHGRTASLVLTVDEPSADVFLDGKKIGVTPMAEVRVLSGVHQLRVMKHGFEPEMRSLSFAGGGEQVVKVRLERSAETRKLGANPLPMWISWGVTGAGALTTLGLSLWAQALRTPVPPGPEIYTSRDLARERELQGQNYAADGLYSASVVAGVATIGSGFLSLVFTAAHIVSKSSEEKSATAAGVWFDGQTVRGRF